MGYITVGNLFTDIFGKDNLTKLKAEGETVEQVYRRYDAALNQYAAEAARIPSGSGEKRLRDTAAKLRAQSAAIAPSFAPGAVPGTETEKRVNDFVTGVKAFGADKSALVRQYGLEAEAAKAAAAAPKATAPAGAKPKPMVAKSSAAGGIPLWGWALGLFALSKFIGGKKKK